MGAAIYCSDCGECLAESGCAEAALAISCGRCGCLVELGEWDRPEDSGVRDTIPGDERVEAAADEDAASPEPELEPNPETAAPVASDDAPASAPAPVNAFSDTPVPEDLAPDSWRTSPITTPSPPGPRVEPFGLAADVPRPPPVVTWLVSLDNRTDDRAMGPKDIKAAILSGELSPANLVWRAGMPEWLPLAEVPEFADVIQEQRELTAAPTPSAPNVDAHSETPLSPGSSAMAPAHPAPAPVEVAQPVADDGDGDIDIDVDDGFSLPFDQLGVAADRQSLAEIDLGALSGPAPSAPQKRSRLLPAAVLLVLLGGGGAAAALFLGDKPDAGQTAPALDATEPDAPTPTAVADPEPTGAPVPEPAPAAVPEEPEPEPTAVPEEPEPTAVPEPEPAPKPLQRSAEPKPRPQPKPSAPVRNTGEPIRPAAPETPPTATFKPVSPGNSAAAEPFSISAASEALDAAAARASKCRKPGDPSGTARIRLTFANSGRATQAVVEGKPFAGTQTGGCIASIMRSARVPEFSGQRRSITKTVLIQ